MLNCAYWCVRISSWESPNYHRLYVGTLIKAPLYRLRHKCLNNWLQSCSKQEARSERLQSAGETRGKTVLFSPTRLMLNRMVPTGALFKTQTGLGTAGTLIHC